MTAPQLVVLADDLTGAADTGGAFAQAGLVTAIPLCDAAAPAVDVLALSSECRDCDECDIEDLLLSTLRQAVMNGPPARWYKKIDSALRGHPGIELAMTMDVRQFERAIVAPALPSESRTTVDGHALVDGVPLHRTSLGTGMSTSSIQQRLRTKTSLTFEEIPLGVVRAGPAAVSLRVGAATSQCLIVDAETDEDLLTIAKAVSADEHLLLVGSAGFAAALMKTLPLVSSVPASPPPLLSSKPILTVAGTRHEATATQIEAAKSSGPAVIRPEDVDKRWTPLQLHELSDRVASSLRQGTDTILTITGCPWSALPGHQLADQLAAVAVRSDILNLIGGMILTGGDVAAAVCSRLDVDFLWLKGEVIPAIPWATLGSGPLSNTPIVTKAGSFGPDLTFVQASRFLRNDCAH